MGKFNPKILGGFGIIIVTMLIIQTTSGSSNQILLYEDPILGIKFQYPGEWHPVTITEKNNMNTISFTPRLATNLSDKIMESRYREITLKIENFFPLQIDLEQYMQKTFAKSRFLKDFNLIESDRMTTLGGSPAYKLAYSYQKGTQGDNVKVLSTNIFTVKNNIAYMLSLEIPVNLYPQYQPGLEKIVETFTLTS